MLGCIKKISDHDVEYRKNTETKYSLTRFDINPGIALGCRAIRRFLACFGCERASAIRFGVHGASEKNCVHICDEGFNPALRNIQTYGPGEYFSAHIWEAIRYARTSCPHRLIVVAILFVNSDCQVVQGLNVVSSSRSDPDGLPSSPNPEDERFLSEQMVVRNPIDFFFSYCLPIGIATFGNSSSTPNGPSFVTHDSCSVADISISKLEAINMLVSMGFQDRESNLVSLRKFNNDVSLVIEALLGQKEDKTNQVGFF